MGILKLELLLNIKKIKVMNINTLQQNFEQRRQQYHDDFRLRIHRALSWLQRSEQAKHEQDIDAQFIFLWIGFNSIYAKEYITLNRQPDKSAFLEYIYQICFLDTSHEIYNHVWITFPHSIRLLLDNHFTFQLFWDYQNGLITQDEWLTAFEKHKRKALIALSEKDTCTILTIVFNHLYTLRNQILHGGATYNSTVNRSQLKDACQILTALIPIFISIMLDNPQEKVWGKTFYPVIK